MRKRKTTGGRLNLRKMSEAMRKVTGEGRKRRAGPDRPKQNRFAPKPGGRFQPKPRPDRDRMILPPRPRKNPSPRLPRAIKELTPEQRKKLLRLMKQKRRK